MDYEMIFRGQEGKSSGENKSILKKLIGPLCRSMQQIPVDINLTTVDPGARDPVPVLG
jgi:hypothetical protein